jgi:hypothetical protein
MRNLIFGSIFVASVFIACAHETVDSKQPSCPQDTAQLVDTGDTGYVQIDTGVEHDSVPVDTSVNTAIDTAVDTAVPVDTADTATTDTATEDTATTTDTATPA